MLLKKDFIRFFLIAIHSFAIGETVAQTNYSISITDQYRSIRWTMQDGLPSNMANILLKDVKGFLWIASAGSELCRFDGAVFKKYIPDPKKRGAIQFDKISAMIEDSLHNIWFGANGGLSRYDMKADTFTNFIAAVDSTNTNKTIIPFWSTRTHVYCLESGAGIITYDIQSLKKETLLVAPHLTVHNTPGINYMILDKESNSLWLLESYSRNPDRGGLLNISLSDGKRVQYSWLCYRKNSIHRHSAEAMKLDRKRNSIWINTGDGLFEFTLADKQFHHIDAFNAFIKLKDYDRWVGIDIDKEGKIWVATQPTGVLIYNPVTEKIRPVFEDPEIQQKTGEYNFHIYCDRDGIVWTSNWASLGIFELLPFNPSNKRFAAKPKQPDSLSNGIIYSIVAAAQGKMWLGTNEGLNIFDPATEKFEVLREKDLPGILGEAIVPLHIDTVNQTAWLNAGSADPGKIYEMKMFEMDIRTRKCNPITFRAGSKKLDTLTIEPIWVQPCKSGLLVYNENFPGVFEVKKGNSFADLIIPLHLKNINRVILGEERFLFLGAYILGPNLYFEYKNGNWIKTPHQLDSLERKSMYYDEKDKTHWVSYTYKLVHYDKSFQEIKSYSFEDGYTGEIFNMITDQNGNLWFANILEQIGRLNVNTGNITMLSEDDGYQKKDFDWAVPLVKDANGHLYFGTGWSKGNKGLDVIYPEKYASVNTSSVYIRSLSINQKPASLSTGVNILEELSLNYNQNTISIETGIIDFYTRGKGNIRYKLERDGKDEAWQFGPAYNTIRYEGLVPGNYNLILQASNAGNEFNGPEKILMIHIRKPFWQTWWFRILTGIIVISLIYGIIQYRSRSLRIRNAQLEEKVIIRTHELHQSLENLKSTQSQLIQSEKMASLGELTAGIAHEIQNPLNFVNNFSDVNKELLAELKDVIKKGHMNEVNALADDVIANEEKINHHGKRAESIVKGMLQHSRKSAGIKEPTDINALADEYIRLSYHGLRAKDSTFQADFEINTDATLPLINIIPQDIGRVLLNIINNAFQAVGEKNKLGITGYKPKVSISTQYQASQVEIKIADNGTGIPAKNKEKIFQPFFTTKPTGQGTGLGLSLAYDIIKAHGGTINVFSNYLAALPTGQAGDRQDPEAGSITVNNSSPQEDYVDTNANQQSGTEFIITLPV